MKNPIAFLIFIPKQFRAASAAAAITALFVAQTAQALTYTWDVASGNSAITDGAGTWSAGAGNWFNGTSYDQNWANGNAAVFGTGTAGSGGVVAISGTVAPTAITFNPAFDITAYEVAGAGTITMNAVTLAVSVPSAQATISAGINTLATAPITAVTNKIAKTGAGKLTLSGQDFLFGDANVALTGIGFTVEGSSELALTGYLKAASTSQSNRGNFTNTIGATDANNTLSISGNGKLMAGGLAIGGSTFGGNSVTISSATPNGSAASASNPSYHMIGNGAQMNIGISSSNNSMTVSNGAYVYQSLGGGTNTWSMGVNSGANSNALTVTGASSSIVFEANQTLNVGMSGSSNSLTVSAGGLFRSSKLCVGDAGGSFNSVTVVGTGVANSATVTLNGGTGGVFEIGSGSTATSNFVSVQAGGVINLTASDTTRNFSIGGPGQQTTSADPAAAGGDTNYLEVTGANSAFNMTAGLPLVVGGTVSAGKVKNITTGGIFDGGNNNHIDISSGGKMTLTSTSLYALGSTSSGNTSVNLGNGVGTSTLQVGATSGYTAGILLNNANGRLNFNSGRLIAGANGALVSGAGGIVLNGPAYISTAFTGVLSGSASTITTAISGSGSLTKEGAGLLTLSGTNTYSGNTNVNRGTLELTSATGLEDTSTVTIDAVNGVLWLNFTGTDNVAGLVIDNVPMPPGEYGAGTTGIDGASTGTLTVGAVPLTPYQSWAKTNITDLNPSADATPGGDPDNDGANNLSEFAFNGDPLSGSDNGKVYLLTADNDTSKKLILTVAVRTGTPVFAGDPSPTATNTGASLTYTILGSTSLIDGFLAKVNVLGTEVIPAEDPTAGTGYEYRSFTLDGSNGLPSKGFLRAMVTTP